MMIVVKASLSLFITNAINLKITYKLNNFKMIKITLSATPVASQSGPSFHNYNCQLKYYPKITPNINGEGRHLSNIVPTHPLANILPLNI